MILADTSVWIDHFRAADTAQARKLREALADGEFVCTCGAVLTEVLQGLKREPEYRRVKRLLGNLQYLPASRATHVLAADLYRQARRRGKTIRGAIDCIIAACAVENDVPVLHRDRDYDALAAISPLRVVPV